MYMSKFGRTKEQVMAMSQQMGQRFAEAGLPYNFSDAALTGNTFNSHRLIAYAGTLGDETQDKVVEALFHAYFADEKFLNAPETLIDAAVAAGIDQDEAQKFVEDETRFRAETAEELEVGKSLRVSGVPHFLVERDGRRVQVGGAQPAEAFEQLFSELLA
eukprot:TRINITY_DN8619_c0_g1_i5.p1 TRINITY_DN8619_c0_g1~~TRINITY_DN8619_c0_g1_i5.p1  ORF type:complete len:160 (+),score=53.54 TRINITY_DN8619_c0_g1_i5:328-807(+)